jgi:hypothetical protein
MKPDIDKVEVWKFNTVQKFPYANTLTSEAYTIQLEMQTLKFKVLLGL